MNLLELPTIECMKLWGELIECFHNKNGFGGNTAEIYAYRLKVGIEGCKEGMPEFRLLEGNFAAASRLVSLVELFESEYSSVSSVRIEEQTPQAWLETEGRFFCHRVRVSVLRNK